MDAFHRSTTLFQTPFLLITCQVSIINLKCHSPSLIPLKLCLAPLFGPTLVSSTCQLPLLVLLGFAGTILYFRHYSPQAREECREAAIKQANQHARANRHALRRAQVVPENYLVSEPAIPLRELQPLPLTITSTFDIPPVPSVTPPKPPIHSHIPAIPAAPTVTPPTPPSNRPSLSASFNEHVEAFTHYNFTPRHHPLEHVALRKSSSGSFRSVESDDEEGK